MRDYDVPTWERTERADFWRKYKFDPDQTQEDMTLNYLKYFGSITDLEALFAFDCRRLSARIYNLRSRGFQIDTEITKGKKNYAIYRLSDK